MKKKIVIVVVVVGLALALALAHRLSALRQRFLNNIAHVHNGMTESQVIATLGRPRRLQRPCYAPRPSCYRDLVYGEPLDIASIWTISVDDSGHVIDIFHWRSP